MLGDRLDRVDRGNVDLAERVAVVRRADGLRVLGGIIPIRPIASAANTSICHQMR